MNISFALAPDFARAHVLDARMRFQLADSLAYIRQVIAEQWGQQVQDLDPVLENMKSGLSYPPSTFGLYYEIAFALFNGDEAIAKSLIAELIQEKPYESSEVSVIGLAQTSPSNFLRYRKFINSDPTISIGIVSLAEDRVEYAVARFKAVLQRFKSVLPEMYAEFSSLVREIILVASDKQASEFNFDGGSCYMLWGALFINAEADRDDVFTIEALVHESSHSLLFSYTIDEPLVNNSDDELFASPLREDLRPMDGIYHATFVSARMHLAMSALIDSGQLDAEELATALAARDADCRNFFCGYETVIAHANMTATGRSLMDSAYGYMQNFKDV